jgi:G3E family GTPase
VLVKHDHSHDHDHEHHDHGHAHHDHEHDDHAACDHDHGNCVHDHDHDHHHSNHLEEDGFTSLSFQSDRPFDIKKFQYFLDHQLPENVFRAKGILWFNESPKRGKRFSLDDDEWKGAPKNQLVLIGQELDHEKLRSQIEHCLSVPSESRGKGFGK